MFKYIFLIIVIFGAYVFAQYKTPRIVPKPINLDTAIVRNNIYIYVKSDGALFMMPGRTRKGKWTSLQNVLAELDSIPYHNGVVFYNRENGTGDPPPVAMHVIDKIGKRALSVMFTNTLPPKMK